MDGRFILSIGYSGSGNQQRCGVVSGEGRDALSPHNCIILDEECYSIISDLIAIIVQIFRTRMQV